MPRGFPVALSRTRVNLPSATARLRRIALLPGVEPPPSGVAIFWSSAVMFMITRRTAEALSRNPPQSLLLSGAQSKIMNPFWMKDWISAILVVRSRHSDRLLRIMKVESVVKPVLRHCRWNILSLSALVLKLNVDKVVVNSYIGQPSPDIAQGENTKSCGK